MIAYLERSKRKIRLACLRSQRHTRSSPPKPSRARPRRASRHVGRKIARVSLAHLGEIFGVGQKTVIFTTRSNEHLPASKMASIFSAVRGWSDSHPLIQTQTAHRRLCLQMREEMSSVVLSLLSRPFVPSSLLLGVSSTATAAWDQLPRPRTLAHSKAYCNGCLQRHAP